MSIAFRWQRLTIKLVRRHDPYLWLGESLDMEAEVNFKTVIFATDFSIFSQTAGIYSAAIARLFSIKLIVAHAFTLTQAALEVEVDASVVSQQRKDLEFLLSEKAVALAHNSLEAVPLLIDGDPKEVLLGLADKYDPSLLVLGTRGEGLVKRKIIGSVAEKVLRSAPRPVLTVGPRVQAAPLKPLLFRRILFATDLSKGAEKAAAMTVSLACKFEADLDVLNVVEDGEVAHPERLEEITGQFYSGLDSIVPERAKDFFHPRTFVEAGNAHEQIIQHIRERSVELLVLGIHRSSRLGMKRKTSGAFRLISEADCPVLTVPG